MSNANWNDATNGTAPQGSWSGSYVASSFAFMPMARRVSKQIVALVVKKHLCILDAGP